MVSVRLTASEFAQIRAAADARGLTVSAFMREVALSVIAGRESHVCDIAFCSESGEPYTVSTSNVAMGHVGWTGTTLLPPPHFVRYCRRHALALLGIAFADTG
jgi:hypothetical protein